MGRLSFGVIVNQIEGRYQTQLQRGLEKLAREENIDLFFFVGRSLSSPYPGENSHNAIYELAKSSRLDGLIVAAGSVGAFLGPEEFANFLASFPTVHKVSVGLPLPGIPSIVTDNRTGVREAVEHLVRDHGRRRLAYVGGPDDHPEARARREAFEEVSRELGVPLDSALFFRGDFSSRSGTLIALEWIKQSRFDWDGLVCANDEMALAIMKVLDRHGLSVPKEFPLAGFDDVSESLASSPPLTTVRQPVFEQGYLAGRLLVGLVRGNDVPALTVLPAHLVVRESCGCPSSAFLETRTVAPSGDGGLIEAAQSIQASVIEAVELVSQHTEELRPILSVLVDTIAFDLKFLKDHPLFLMALGEWLKQTFEWDDFLETWHSLLGQFRLRLGPFLNDAKTRVYCEDLFQSAFSALAQKNGQREAARYSRLLGFFSNLKEAANQIAAGLTGQEAQDSLLRCLTASGFKRGFLALHTQGPQDLGGSQTPQFGALRTTLSFGMTDTPFDENFSAPDLLPSWGHEALNQSRERGSWAYMPLFANEKHFGLVALDLEGVETVALDTLREELSSALAVTGFVFEKQESEAELHERLNEAQDSEKRWRDVVEALPLLVVETDQAFFVHYANRSANEALEWDAGRPNLRRLFHAEVQGKLVDVLTRLVPGEEVSPIGVKLESRSGGWVLVTRIVCFRERGQTRWRWHALDLPSLVKDEVSLDDRFFIRHKISPREREVVEGLFMGLRIREIALRLKISESTVKGHLAQIYDKCGVENRFDLMSLIQDAQVDRHGYENYLFGILGRLLSYR